MEFKRKTLAFAVLTTLLSACGGSGGGSSKDDDSGNVTNTAPTDITLSNSTVDENSPGAVIGTLSASDAQGGAISYTIDNESLALSGNELSLAAGYSADYETATTLTVNVTATDAGGLSFSKVLTINVNDLLDTYQFASKFVDGESSVSYSGQIARHVLIEELNYYIGNVLKGELDDGTLTSKQDVIDRLNKFFRTSEEQYDNFEILSIDAEQGFLTDISGSKKNLVEKLAGNDTGGQHKDWNNGDFNGWGGVGAITPEQLVDVFFDQLADNAEQYLLGNARFDINGDVITAIYLNSNGTDLKQLIQKFLLMAVAYSQATDDYFGHETDGKGLTTDNIAAEAGKPYSTLEHQFDEGFGYFGAAQDYLAYSDDELANSANNKEGIDLLSEYNFGQSINAAKRDLGTAGNSAPTDLTKQAMEAFLAARAIINDNAGMALTETQMTELKAQRDLAVDAWEKAIVATVIHYINDTRADLAAYGSDDFNFANLAKHWSELKGFALGLQFNPYSKVTDGRFDVIHDFLGTEPVLSDEVAVEAYADDLLVIRGMLAESLDFDEENVANW